MTISLAASFPWGRLKRIIQSAPGPGRIPGGIILATDSRWTYEGRPPEDKGQKLWKLAPERGIGAVYSGDVWLAEDALDRAQREIAALNSIHPDVVAPVVERALSTAYERHREKRKKVGPLYVLVGMADRDGSSIIIKYNYSLKFAPLILFGVQTVGSETACQAIETELSSVDEMLMPSHGSWSLDIAEWALNLAMKVFSKVIEAESEPTVGGGIQIATIAANGWTDLGILRTPHPADAAKWERISIEEQELERWRRKFKQPPLASNPERRI